MPVKREREDKEGDKDRKEDEESTGEKEESKEEESQGQDKAVRAAAIKFVSGNSEAVLIRKDLHPSHMGTPPRTPPQEALPAGKTLRSESSASSSAALSADEMRQRRLAMLGGSTPRSDASTPASSPAPKVESPSTTAPPPAPPKKELPAGTPPPRTSSAASPHSIPSSSSPVGHRFACSPGGFLLRFILQVQREDESLETEDVHPMLTAVFLGEDISTYTKVPSGAVWKTVESASQLPPEAVEQILQTHPQVNDISYIIACLSRCESSKVTRDKFVTMQLVDSFEAIRRALVLHCVPEILAQLEKKMSPQTSAKLAAVLNAEEVVARKLLEEMGQALESQGALASFSNLLDFVLVKGSDAELQQQGGMQQLLRLCNHLHRLVLFPSGSAQLSRMISDENTRLSHQQGIRVVPDCWARRFLMVPDLQDLRSILTSGLPGYPRVNPAETESVLETSRRVLTGLTNTLSAVLRDGLLKKAAERQIVLTWMYRMLECSNTRLDFAKNQLQQQRMKEAPHPFALNFASVVLALAHPVCKKEWGSKVDIDFVRSVQAMEAFPKWEGEKRMDRSWSIDSSDIVVPETPFSFSTEIFFVGMQALHVMIAPSIRVARWLHDMYVRGLIMIQSSGKEVEGSVMQRIEAIALEWDMLRCLLLNPDTVYRTLDLAITALRIVERDMDKAEGDTLPPSVAALPAFFFQDSLDYLVFVCQFAPEVVQNASGMPQLLRYLIKASVHPTFLRQYPLIEARIVTLVAAMRDQNPAAHHPRLGDAWEASQWGGHRRTTSLFNIVEEAQCLSVLPRVLFRTYSSVEGAEGYDIDKDEHVTEAKHQALSLFVQLIVVPRFREGLIESLQGSDDEEVAYFVHRIVTESTHCLDDALNRLIEVNDIEKAMKDRAKWESQPSSERKRAEQHLVDQQRSAKGFMQSAVQCLQIVQMLLNPTRADRPPPAPPAVKAAPVLRSLSHLVRYFLAQLYGKRGSDLRSLASPGKYGYDRLGIIQVLVNIVVLLCDTVEFQRVFALSDDYERWVITATVDEVNKTQLGGQQMAERLQRFAATLQDIAPQSNIAPSMMEIEELEWNPPVGKVVVMDSELYTKHVGDMQVEEAELTADEDFVGFHFREQIASTRGDVGGLKAKVKAINRDRKLLLELPLFPQASVFARLDSRRVDAMRLIITGPEDTPYAFGMFVFDVYFPADYPNVPPQLWLRTTGGGTVRFNPNLYENGKVCLSLLGTWHGEGAETKWQAGQSSVYQIGTSIQSMILVPDPYFNEPGNEGHRHTEEGIKWSTDYNEGLRLATMRYAMTDNIRNPPEGCEEVVKTYYKSLGPAVLACAHKWVKEASEHRRHVFAKAFNELCHAMQSLLSDEATCCQWQDAARAKLLPPLKEAKPSHRRNQAPPQNMDVDDELERALRASELEWLEQQFQQQQQQQQQQSSQQTTELGQDLLAALRSSMANTSSNINGEEDEDAALARALELSKHDQ